ncbi:hypothetical protein ACFL3H_05095 [Gemmatimonadota bacterium]
MSGLNGSRVTRISFGIVLLVCLTTCDGSITDGDGFGSNRNWAGNYLRIKLIPEQHPLLGEYSSRNAAIIQTHVSWAQQAEIDFFAIAWRGLESWGHETLEDYVLEEPAFDDMSWCILYETPTILGDSPDSDSFSLTLADRDTLLNQLLYFNNHFFSRDNYLHIDGKPVVFLRQSRKITGDARIALNAMRIAYADSTGGESVYLVGDEVIWGTVALPDRSRISAMDAITGIDLSVLSAHDGYPAGTGVLEDVALLWQEYATVISELPEAIPIVPTVWPGYNDRAWAGITHPIISREVAGGIESTGSTYDQMWLIAGAQASDPAVILLNSFNDWQRDTQIEVLADNQDVNGTTSPTTVTRGIRYFPYANQYIERTAINKGDLLLGAIYEIWYDNQPPDDMEY